MDTYIGCSVIIHDNDNKVLIAQRGKSKKRFPLLWETVGGALENDETPEECIRRETMEELNCNIDNLELFKVYIINQDNRYVLIVYTGKINEKIQYNSEIEQIRWIDKSDVENFCFYGNEAEKLMDYYNNYFIKASR
ncbi:NUDIX hydrolase [Clostridium estertheticum]|uniref:NUDIX hydrolase n=1 Tax=Clostridium estertheticum TaxID=238834 RepID=UPI001C0E17CF|nr:NUDIX domain-containing protein [Clostridium estertheticum]MBU3074491.1 NUDIX domain-containing protein [Clostridium estertheticum]MBU3165955.1 NUDIX domain-containing protein [Clostridium estertheticum]MBU3173835.1 NUDIX domain-containing protein [Clostridium estertheticum]